MTAKMKKKIIQILSVTFGIYIASGCISAAVMINLFIKRPQGGWPNPLEHLSGSRAPFEKQLKQSKEWLDLQKTEKVEITSFDGLKLAGLMLEQEKDVDSKGCVILMHGYHSRAWFEFSGFYQYFFENGYNILLADQRSHGNSQGKFLTFGIKERFDCLGWVNFANERYGQEKPLWLCGVSMGSSTVLMSLGLEMPANVKGVIADCGFTSPAEIISVCIKRDYHLPDKLLMPFINLGTQLFCGFGLNEYSVQEALKNNKIPVLFLHGKNDAFVPFYMSQKNYEACTAPKKFLQTDAMHAVNFLHNTAEYEQALKDFMN